MGTIERVYKCKGPDPERGVGAAAALPAALEEDPGSISAVSGWLHTSALKR